MRDFIPHRCFFSNHCRQSKSDLQKINNRFFHKNTCLIKKGCLPLHREKEIVQWCNGSTSDSGSACEGSSPSWTTVSKIRCVKWHILFFVQDNPDMWQNTVE